MNFDIKKYAGRYVMHCKTEEEAKNFCNYLHSVGRCWRDGTPYLIESWWSDNTEYTGYIFNEGMYAHVNSSCLDGYTILNWSDFIDDTHKEFTKADFKTGDVVLYRNGCVGIVNRELKTSVLKNDWVSLDALRADLTHGRSSNWDVMKIRRPVDASDCQYNAFRCERGKLVYERKEPEEMTLEEVCKALGKEIKIVEKHN